MTLVVVIAVLMTVISLSLYVSSGTLQLDLSRPGYESVRKNIVNPNNRSEFASSGPVNTEVLNEYQKRFDSQRGELNAIGSFKDAGLEDASLGLNAPEPTE